MPGSEIALPKCHSKDVDQGDWLSQRNWIRLPESKRKGRVVQSRRKEKNKNKDPTCCVVWPKKQSNSSKKTLLTACQAHSTFSGGWGTHWGTISPILSCYTHAFLKRMSPSHRAAAS